MTTQHAAALSACQFCRTPRDELATTCTGCGATRRKRGRKWTNYREGRRNDIILSAIGVVVIFWLLTAVLYVVAFSTSSSRSTTITTPCTRSNPNYPFC